MSDSGAKFSLMDEWSMSHPVIWITYLTLYPGDESTVEMGQLYVCMSLN